MVHVPLISEGFYGEYEKLAKYFHGKVYADGKAKVRWREVRFAIPCVNECGLNEFLSDLKSFFVGPKSDNFNTSLLFLNWFS